MKRTILLSMVLIFSLISSAQKFEQLAKTPPMGFNTWNAFYCDIDEKKIMEMADNMVSKGLFSAGYEYLVVDDCWQVSRDSAGNIVADPKKFPSGIKALADYVHARGLKFGIYSDAGALTCAGRPAGRGHEYQDAISYAKWGVDYLKYDWCNTNKLNAEESYTTMRDALYAAGRPILFSLCEWGNNKPWEWAKPVGHMWRTTGDIANCFDCKSHWGSLGVLQILDLQLPIRQHSGVGHWNDMDMLQVGNNGMSTIEEKTHFSMWAMLASPLMAGCDLRKITKETLEILTNKEMIEINQDALGISGIPAMDYGDYEIWFKPLSNNSFAYCFLNRSKEPLQINENLRNYLIQLVPNSTIEDNFVVRDIWKHKEIGVAKDNIKATIAPHDVLVVKVYKK